MLHAGATFAAAPRVLVLTAAMGSGHLQVSRELARRLEELGYECRVVDVNDLLPEPAARFMRWVYPWMVNRAPWLYGLVYRIFFQAPQDHGERVALPVLASLPGLRRYCRGWRPDAVVSTYHLAAQAAARLRADGTLDALTITFVTTFGVHELWVHPATDAYLCISPLVEQRLLQRTTRPVHCCGPVVGPDFDPRLPPRPDPASRLDRHPVGRRLDPGRRVALIVAGSLGLGDLRRAIGAVAGAEGWQAVVVCGRNDRLRAQLVGSPAAVVLGWVDDMATVIRRVDVVVDNAGGLTAKEALALGVPVLVLHPIAGHGRDDAEAMVALGVSEIVDDDAELPDALARAVRDGEVGAERVRRGRELFVGDAARAVADLLPAGPAARTG